MKKTLENIAIEQGYRIKVISAERLKELQEIIADFKSQEKLNDFQSWIVDKLYRYEPGQAHFNVKSIILIAVPHPFYAKVDFYRNGHKKTFLSLVRPDFDKAEGYIKGFAVENGYSLVQAENLPMKRLAAHCGLAEYGRNNITYIDGLGSNFSYMAFFSDMEVEQDTWSEVHNAMLCSTCHLCIDVCPTDAISKDRFLIDNERCLSCINEVPGDFPDWIPSAAHHTLYDCLICQRACPMNKKQLDKVVDSISFSEEETSMLLDGKPIDTFSEQLKEKVYSLGLDEWYQAIPRNLKVLFDFSDRIPESNK